MNREYCLVSPHLALKLKRMNKPKYFIHFFVASTHNKWTKKGRVMAYM